MDFQLHERLAADTVPVTVGPLSQILLMTDANFPWLVLVPQRQGLRDFHDLSAGDLTLVTQEIVAASRVLEDSLRPDKINVAALGKQVPQLRVHVIARFHDDPAWPKPVWGVLPPKPYTPEALTARVKAFQTAFAEGL